MAMPSTAMITATVVRAGVNVDVDVDVDATV